MSSPAVFKERSLWYESSPSVLTTARKCAAATPHPLGLVYLPHRKSKASGSPHETTVEEVQQVRVETGKVGLYTEPRWFPPDTGAWLDIQGRPIISPLLFRKAVSTELLALYKIGDPVMFDWEKLPSDWITAFLLGTPGQQGWRGKDGIDNGSGTNPGRPSAWTDAPFQIGNYSDGLLSLLDKFGFAYFIQLYYGAMAPVEEREDAIREPRDRGFPGIDCWPFYDAAHQPGPNTWRQGCLFTSNRWNYLLS